MKLNNLFVVSAAVLGLAACSPQNQAPIQSAQNQNNGIVGGVEVESSDPIAAMTGLLVDTQQGSICTASILSDEWLLTAAHCVEGATSESLAVLFVQKFDESKPEEMKKAARRVQSFKQHPGFAETMKKLQAMEEEAQRTGTPISHEEVEKVTDWGDVALVRLAEKIPSTHKPAKILAMSEKLAKSQGVVLAGYGVTSHGPMGGSGEGILRKVDVTISEPVWGKTEVLLDQTNSKGACHGDSGGPAYATIGGELHLWGVTSRGVRDEQDTCTRFSAYTNVQSYGDWIKEVSGL